MGGEVRRGAEVEGELRGAHGADGGGEDLVGAAGGGADQSIKLGWAGEVELTSDTVGARYFYISVESTAASLEELTMWIFNFIRLR